MQLKFISLPPTPPESPSSVGDTDDVIAVSVSVAVVVVVIIVAIVVSFTTATIIVIKYKHLKLTTNPTQSDSPQEPPSSRCVRESGAVSSRNINLHIIGVAALQTIVRQDCRGTVFIIILFCLIDNRYIIICAPTCNRNNEFVIIYIARRKMADYEGRQLEIRLEFVR